ncbi:MAG: ABC transport system permease protein [Candidatus Magnetoglobus multicellularis str. Araruama]|uniref:ABC transport system permease protein n=1 Tax=Candidatus Magnetoglobus multicellularis str. Araruama TaxID=890399 RepID=A0A1V1PDX1_9BACT|nr:MAG: ABC transport system permease protein [Candidatus Magnetoglobus multicellularis str. Araruama]
MKDIRFSFDHTQTDQTIILSGTLDVSTCGTIWHSIFQAISATTPKITVDVSQLTYCDTSGVALFVALRSHAQDNKQHFEIQGLSPEINRLYTRFVEKLPQYPPSSSLDRTNIIEKAGHFVYHQTQGFIQGLYAHIVFIGELTAVLFQALCHPSRIRWKDVWLISEKSGANALPIVGLIGFLMGLILAFQSVVPMAKFGAEIFVADLIGLSMIRELAPLMTAIVLAGRTGSAFAAEIGAMKVNEEIDALTTMGLDPMNFLVVVRVMAALIVTPVLTIYADIISVVSGSIPLISMGYPIVTYYNRVIRAVDYIDLLSGLFKSIFFGLLVASAGCKCGLQTQTGAGAVGESTTQAVVNSIILIVVCDGIFSVMFYYLKI